MAEHRRQGEHDTMVRSVVAHLKEQGHSNIKADLIGYERPDEIYWDKAKQGAIPDATSTKDRAYIFEVETDDSINDTHTEAEWRLFAAHAKQQSKLFVVVVPKGLEQQASQRAAALGVSVDSVWAVG